MNRAAEMARFGMPLLIFAIALFYHLFMGVGPQGPITLIMWVVELLVAVSMGLSWVVLVLLGYLLKPEE
jgi:hypothetical protein